MNKQPSLEELNATHKNRIHKTILFVLGVLCTFVITFFLNQLFTKLNATSTIEYTKKLEDTAFFGFGNIAKLVEISISGKKIENISMVELSFHNRTNSPIKNLPIRISVKAENNKPSPEIVHKLLTYPTEEAREWFEWEDIKDNSNANVVAKVMNVQYWEDPNFKIQLFFNSKTAPDVIFYTTRAGFEFKPLKTTQDGPNYWFFFGWGWFFVIVIFTSVLIAMLYGLDKLDTYMRRQAIRAFSRVYSRAVLEYAEKNPYFKVSHLIEMGAEAFVRHTYRRSFKEKHDPKVTAPQLTDEDMKEGRLSQKEELSTTADTTSISKDDKN